MKRGQQEYEPRWEGRTAGVALFIFTIIPFVICVFIGQFGPEQAYYYYTAGFGMYFFSFIAGIRANLLGKVREPTASRYHLICMAAAMAITCFTILNVVAINFLKETAISLHQTIPFHIHRIFFSVHLFVSTFDETIFGGKIFGCLKNHGARYIIQFIIAIIVSVGLYGGAGMGFFSNPNAMILSSIGSFFSWLDLCMFFIAVPMRDVFGEMRFFMKLGVGIRGIFYLLIAICCAILNIGVCVGVTFLDSFSFDEATGLSLEDRFYIPLTVSCHAWIPLVLQDVYTDNYVKEHPILPVDLNDKARGQRKGVAKNAKPSQKGMRFIKRMGFIYGIMIAGYTSFHTICRGLHIFGNFDNWIQGGDEGLVMIIASCVFGHGYIMLGWLLKTISGDTGMKGANILHQTNVAAEEGKNAPTAWDDSSAQKNNQLQPVQMPVGQQYLSQYGTSGQGGGQSLNFQGTVGGNF